MPLFHVRCSAACPDNAIFHLRGFDAFHIETHNMQHPAA
jgi:hypothetical protein